MIDEAVVLAAKAWKMIQGRKRKMIDEAIEFATRAHDGQFRKGTRRPYIVHPVEVADIVATMTKDEEIISAAVLHDTIEDCEWVTEDMLRSRFGDRVATIVAKESEDKSKSWEERKGHTIRYLYNAPREVQMIGLADKLSNMRDIDRDYPVYGEDLWKRFRMQSKSAIAWYYRGVREALRQDFKGVQTFEEYCSLIHKNFGADSKDLALVEKEFDIEEYLAVKLASSGC